MPSSADGRDSPANGTFYRYASDQLREAFSTLPDRSQFNRLVCFYADDIEEMAVKLGRVMEGSGRPYQALDASAMPTRDVKRRGHGWLAGDADIGWSNSLGWYEGFSLLSAVEPSGAITGFCFAPASTADQLLAETFSAVRAYPTLRLPCAGPAACVPHMADKGFEGIENHQRWFESYGAEVIHPPNRNSKNALTQTPQAVGSRNPPDRRDSLRQAVQRFRPMGEWGHELQGLRARLAARVALHNFCIWLNDRFSRPQRTLQISGW